MKILLASDHAGFELKEKMKKYVEEQGYEFEDLGTNSGVEKASYANYGQIIGREVVKQPGTIGIAVCGTGIGISIAANRIKGARAARVTSIEDGRLSKEHNNANILAFGGRQMSFELSRDIFEEFMKAEYEGGRHQDRINQLDK